MFGGSDHNYRGARCSLTRNFLFAKTPRASFLAENICAVWSTRHPHTPHKEYASISPVVVACDEL